MLEFFGTLKKLSTNKDRNIKGHSIALLRRLQNIDIEQ